MTDGGQKMSISCFPGKKGSQKRDMENKICVAWLQDFEFIIFPPKTVKKLISSSKQNLTASNVNIFVEIPRVARYVQQ